MQRRHENLDQLTYWRHGCIVGLLLPLKTPHYFVITQIEKDRKGKMKKKK